MNAPSLTMSASTALAAVVLGILDGLVIVMSLAASGAAQCGIPLMAAYALIFTLGVPFLAGIVVSLALTVAIPRFRNGDFRIHTVVTAALLAVSAGLLIQQGSMAHPNIALCSI